MSGGLVKENCASGDFSQISNMGSIWVPHRPGKPTFKEVYCTFFRKSHF